jgi:ribonuclease Y
MTIIIATIAGLISGFTVSFLLANRVIKNKESEAKVRAKSIITDAEKKAENIQKEKLIEIKEEISKKRIEYDSEFQYQKARIQSIEKQIKQKEEQIVQKENIINQKLDKISKIEKQIEEKKEQISNLMKGQAQKLEKISSMTRDEAKKILLENTKHEIKADTAKLLNQAREEIKIKSSQEAQNIILAAIQRSATDICVENTVTVVNLESDEMKGRIIGREGRNIRTFESATGTDLIIDDTPESVIVSGYDPFRREIAKRALLKLMHDGRIHPARIEEVVAKASKELDEELVKNGADALLQLGIHNMHVELERAVGRMKYRTSYGQNLLNHSIEVAYLAGIIASELGLDPRIAKRAALLHDIGKCANKEIEGTHAKLGADIAKKYKENHVIVNAIAAHHDDVEHETPYATIVQIADGISGARPGARKESIENYMKRLEKLEEISTSFDGVNKCFAIQAGREIRVIVEPDKIDDAQTIFISNEIAKKIENEMEYPGQIKVTVIREKRSISIAK